MRPFWSLKFSFSWLLTKQTFHEYLNEGIQPVATSKVERIRGTLLAVILKCENFFFLSFVLATKEKGEVCMGKFSEKLNLLRFVV